MRPIVKFSEDVVPIGDLRSIQAGYFGGLASPGRPVLLTSRGRGVAVMQTLPDYEAAQEERDFMRAVLAGLFDLEEGRECRWRMPGAGSGSTEVPTRILLAESAVGDLEAIRDWYVRSRLRWSASGLSARS